MTVGLGSIHLALVPLLGARFPFLLFYGAVIMSSLLGGMKPGLLSLALSVLFATYGLLEPEGRSAFRDPANVVALAIFVAIGMLTATGAQRLRSALLEAECARRRSETLEVELAAHDRSKDHFLSVLAHELRQPLQAIRMASTALRAPGADHGHVIGIVDRQVAQLSRLVADLNDLTRIKQGRLTFDAHPCDLRDVVAGAVDGHREHLAEHGVRLDVNVPDAPLDVSADAARLQQALSNLLHNAARATPPGGAVSIHVARDGPDAVVRVVDTGVGIARDLLPHIFSLFVQDDREGAARLGVGLALVHSIVTRHGGAVHVHSDGPGTGAAFEIRLPAATAPRPAEAGAPIRR